MLQQCWNTAWGAGSTGQDLEGLECGTLDGGLKTLLVSTWEHLGGTGRVLFA